MTELRWVCPVCFETDASPDVHGRHEPLRPVTRYCRACEVWTDEPACWCCGGPGIDTRADWRTVTARSWRNPATWTPDLEETS